MGMTIPNPKLFSGNNLRIKAECDISYDFDILLDKLKKSFIAWYAAQYAAKAAKAETATNIN
jgi:hypothetical protein